MILTQILVSHAQGYVTYCELIQFWIMMISFCGLVYQVCKNNKRK